MATLIEELRLAGLLAFDAQYFKGSTIDTVALTGSSTVATPAWSKTIKGESALYCQAGAAIYYADSLARQMIGGSSTWVLTGGFRQDANARFIDKSPCYQILVTATDFYLYVNGVYSSIAHNITQRSMLVVTLVAGSKPKFYADGVAYGDMSAAVTPVASVNALVVGSNAAYANPSNSRFSRFTMASTVLSPAQVARLYTDWRQQGPSVALAKRGFVYQYPSKTAAEYTAKGIVLDTDFVSEYPAGVRRIRDLTGNYPGTITGIIVPGPNGEGATLPVAASDISWGDVTQFNSTATFSMEWSQDTPAGNIPLGYCFLKYPGALNNVRCGPVGVPAVAKGMYFAIANAGDAYGISTLQMRAGTKQHFLAVFNGNGVGNAGRAQLYVDGEDGVLAAWVGVIPAVTANMAGTALVEGAGSAVPSTRFGRRFYTGALTAAQARAAYLANFAQKLDLRVTLEDTPVSLVASVAAPGQIGPWSIISSTWKCSEDATGRRSMNNVLDGSASMPHKPPFGTWYFRMNQALVAPGRSQYTMFIASQPGVYTGATNNGYMLYLTNGDVRLIRVTAGAATNLATAGVLVAGVEYEFCVSRRPSDGLFKVWIRGGAYVAWTWLFNVTDITHTTSEWINIAMVSNANSLWPQFDFQDKSVGLFHWPGQLDPTVPGELKLQ